jgi:hypothetical protein
MLRGCGQAISSRKDSRTSSSARLVALVTGTVEPRLARTTKVTSQALPR